MQEYFYAVANLLDSQLQPPEIYLCNFSAEQSDFIRFNQGKIRQVSSVEQRYLEIELIEDERHIKGQLSLTGNMAFDVERVMAFFKQLREQIGRMPKDPYLLYATEVHSTVTQGHNALPQTEAVSDYLLSAVAGNDFVGIYAAGGIFTGFANSLGQRNWHSSHNFNLNWSFYHQQDKAVKSSYAGFQWEPTVLQNKINVALEQLQILQRQPKTIPPGRYRVYLSPAALYEIFQLLSYGGFGLKAQRTKESPLLRLMDEPKQTLHSNITLRENIADGIAPGFQAEGFLKPAQVTLIDKGVYQAALISPRSAREYQVTNNGANGEEIPTSLDLAAGNFASAEVLKTLNTGIYINNLWYLNYSDRAACRLTGMTRFASFWVENGEIVAPLNVMRFDETLYHILGSNLIALTAEREFIIEADTYEVRSTRSARLPGALVDGFTLTL